MNGQTILVMDSDCCEMCNGLLDYFGQCPHCGWDSVYGFDWDDSDDDDYYADCYEDEEDY